MHAAWDFQEKARKAGLKPILGMEAYVAPGDRRTRGRPAPGAKPYYHLVLLARDLQGYRNLVKLTSLAYTEGFYTKPRIDRELLAAHSEGLIVSSACLAGEIATHLMDDRLAEAREAAAWYAEVFKGPLLPRGAGAHQRRAVHAQRQGAVAGRRPRAAGRRHQRRALPARTRTTTRTTCCSASAWARIATTAIACTTTTDCTSSPPTRSARSSPAATTCSRTRSPSPSRWTCSSRRSTTCRRSRCPRAWPPRTSCSCSSPPRARRRATVIRFRDEVKERLDYELGRHHEDRLRRLLPHHRRLHQGGA